MLEWLKGLQLSMKFIMAICLGVLVLLIITLGPAACNKIRSLGAQVDMNDKQSNAYHASTVNAISDISAVGTNAAAAVEIGRQNEEDIRHAQGANQSVDADANARGLRALCGRAGHRNDPECRVPNPHPR